MKVSVICPSHKRPAMLKRAVELFLAQDYPDKEMIIIDSDDNRSEQEYAGPEIFYYPVGRASIGQKRNIGCNFASGQIIVHMDDDDYYCPRYISRMVEYLIGSGADLTGLRSAYFYQPHSRLWQYTYPENAQPYVIGASMVYWRKTWERAPFPDISEGEDAIFCATAGKVRPHYNDSLMVAMIHGGNTASHKQLHKKEFKPINPRYAQVLLGGYYEKY